MKKTIKSNQVKEAKPKKEIPTNSKGIVKQGKEVKQTLIVKDIKKEVKELLITYVSLSKVNNPQGRQIRRKLRRRSINLSKTPLVDLCKEYKIKYIPKGNKKTTPKKDKKVKDITEVVEEVIG